MDKLISDRAQVEISKRVHDILRALLLMIGRVNPTVNIKTLLREESKLLKEGLILSLIEMVLLHMHGY